MRQGGEPQGVQIVRQGEPTPYHCDFNPLYSIILIDWEGWIQESGLYPSKGYLKKAWTKQPQLKFLNPTPKLPKDRTGINIRPKLAMLI